MIRCLYAYVYAFLSQATTVLDHHMADAKRKRAAGGEPEEDGYVRLAPSVAKFMGGKRYCKEPELTLCRLLAYGRSKGRISECLQLVRVTVTNLGGETTTHTLDSEDHKVRDLKFRVEEEQGIEYHAQRFSYAPTAGEADKVGFILTFLIIYKDFLFIGFLAGQRTFGGRHRPHFVRRQDQEGEARGSGAQFS